MSVVMNSITTHPSVRLKGAENAYDPVLCTDTNCVKKYVAHMHCPFCVRTEFFTDPVILKAHYRVKHVDKGIEFAGLKIVRCCDHCDIVGSIKGSKELKGAHWHCFRCKNGFNRRDEALKHYRTHFRNAQTTFQIHITQDVNQTLIASSAPNDLLPVQTAQEIIANTERVVDGIVAVSDDRCLQVSVAANETVDTTTSGDLPTVMVLPSKNSLADVIQVDTRQEVNAAIFSLSSEAASSSDVWSQQHSQPSIGTDHLKINPDQTSSSDAAQLQIRQLQLQVKKQAAEIEAMKRREVELVGQLEVPLDDRIVQLLQKMKTEHEELLHRQLEELRMEYLRHIAPSPSATPSHCPPSPQPMFILSGCNGQRIRFIPTATHLTSRTGSLGFTTFASGPGLLSGILPSQDGEVVEGEEEEEAKDSGDLVEDGLVSETVQNFIVAADDMSEYVDTEDGASGHAEVMPGTDGGDLGTHEDMVVIQESNKRKADEPDCGLSPKRERI